MEIINVIFTLTVVIVIHFNTAPNASNCKTLLTNLSTQNTQGVKIKQGLHIPVRCRHSCAHAFNHSDIKREWPLGIKTGCALIFRLKSKAELVFHASRRKLGWAGRREASDSLYVLSRIKDESKIDGYFESKDTQWGAVEWMSWKPLTSKQAPVVASHTHSTDWFWTRFNQRTVRRVLLIQLTIEM